MTTDVSRFCLRKPPAIHVLLQLLFAPRAAEQIETLFASLGNQVAQLGYPFFGQGTIETVVTKPGGGLTHQRPIIVFMDRDQGLQFVIADDGVVVQTSRYTRFVEFQERIAEALPVVLERLPDRMLKRVGLRYINLVRPSEGKSFLEYLNPGIAGHGLPDSIATEHFWRTENYYEGESSGMAVRCSRLKSGPLLPPGIEPLGLDYQGRDVDKPDPTTAVLDIDCFTRRESAFTLDSISEQLQPLNEHATRLFMESITPYARQEWEEE